MENKKPEADKTLQRKNEPVVANPATTKKKSLLARAKDEFFYDGADIAEHLVLDIFVPALKKTFYDSAVNLVYMILYGGKTPRNDSTLSVTKTPYRSAYESKNPDYAKPKVQQFAFNDIVFKTRGDADAVLNALNEAIAEYGFVKVADYYDFSGINFSYTDNYYGWTDLRAAEVVRLYDGYTIRLPKPMPID